MIGADICGFEKSTTEELCARWIEVGAFYPFARDHNAINQLPQELYIWDTVAEASRNALAIRYQLLPYLYTLFYQAHTTGSTVARSLWLNFPEDEVALTVDRQFMWGDKILISPVLDAGATSVSAYFPASGGAAYWYDFSDQSLAIDATGVAGGSGVWKTLATPLTKVNVHIKGGSILPLQQAAMTTTAGRATPFRLVVALCPGGKAFGELFWDDGEEVELKRYLSVSYQAAVSDGTGSVASTILHDSYLAAKELHIEEIIVLGKGMSKPSSVMLNGHELTGAQVIVSESGSSIHFVGMHTPITGTFALEWKY